MTLEYIFILEIYSNYLLDLTDFFGVWNKNGLHIEDPIQSGRIEK